MKHKLAAGNWKMNGLTTDLVEIEALIGGLGEPECDVLICPPAPLIKPMHELAIGSVLQIGAQDCHQNLSGAHTGDISAALIADAGATYVILGHSERRADYGESNVLIAAKASTALERGLSVIVCVGETEAQRDAGLTLEVVGEQMSGSLPDECVAAHTIIAYEPVWAIGTGRTAMAEQIEEVHAFMRNELTTRFGDPGTQMRLLYGGSVKPDNAGEIFALQHVNGALVGGASLKASDFLQIVAALSRAAN